MISAAKQRIGFAAALLAGAVLMQEGFAQAPPPGVFSEIQSAIVPRTAPALEPATMRSRVVQVDTQKITAARRGREVLKLNLFDDAVVEVRIKHVRPTRTGYFISGTPKGMDWGEIRLVVNGSVMVGTVETSEGKFTIRSGGARRHVIRQVDPLKEPFECDAEETQALSPSSLPAIASIGSPVSQALSPVPQVNDMPTEDGSQVRVLVVYTSARQAQEGGTAGMQALVDLLIQSTNQSFEDSGINPRLVVAHTAMVDYVAASPLTDLYRLRDPADGYMDGVHALRNKHAADLVHLLTETPPGRVVGAGYIFLSEGLTFESNALAVTADGTERVFTHEIGHLLGLRHDRYVEPSGIQAIYPYAFGYVNKEAFAPGAQGNTRWRTVMAYNRRCSDSGVYCPPLLRFANPDQNHLGDPLGVDADSAITGVDGPADARRAVNNTARWVGSFRSEACTDFSVSPNPQVAPVEGGEVVLRVDTDTGCVWDASSHSEFLTITSDVPSAGTGDLRVQVGSNNSNAERSGTLTVAGHTVSVRQLATNTGICGRTSSVVQEIARRSRAGRTANCADITEEHLAEVTSLHFYGQGISELREGDFAGLSELRLLYLHGNQLTSLPEGLFDGLSSLTTINMGNNRLSELPEDPFSGLSNLQSLILSRNKLKTLPAGLFSGLGGIEKIYLTSNEITNLPSGLFAGLSSLEYLLLGYNDISSVPADLFAGLSSLEQLQLNSNALTNLPPGLFAGLSSLNNLELSSNQLTSLSDGIFRDLANLETLSVGLNRIEVLHENSFAGLGNLKLLDIRRIQMPTLPASLFSGLSNLEELSLWDSELTTLPSGIFSALTSLQFLNLHSNKFTEFQSGQFSGLTNLQRLNVGGHEMSTLPEGVFSGLSSLEDLSLYKSRLTALPGGVFRGLTALKKLNLFRNRLSSLPDGVFSRLASLDTLILQENRVDPLPILVGLEKVGENQFKAVAPTGAPFSLDLAVSSSSAGVIDDGSSSITLPAGALESQPLSVTRIDGAEEAVSVDIGRLPARPPNHSGYEFMKAPSLPVRILPSLLSTDAKLVELTLSGGTLTPEFDPETASYTATVSNALSSLTVTPTFSNLNATVAYLDGADQTIADADSSADGQQVNLGVGENTIKMKVTAADTTTMRTYVLVVTREDAPDVFGGVCARTEQVRGVIVEAVSAVDNCGDVTEAHLSAITSLDLSDKGIASVQSGDFAGLTGLTQLVLEDNDLTALPSDLLDGLKVLEKLNLKGNDLGALSAGDFADLESLSELYLGGNRLSALPAGVFSGLSALQELWLGDNQLTSLPEGVFSALNALAVLNLSGNSTDPLAISVSLENVGESEFKAVMPTGAPFAIALPVSASDEGGIADDADTVTVSTGAVESSALGVTRVSGTTGAVTVDIGTLPDLPAHHSGYILEKDTALPLAIPSPTESEPQAPNDATLSNFALGDVTMTPVFASATTSYTGSAENAVAVTTIVATASNSNATVAFLDANDQALEDELPVLDRHQLNLSVGDNTIKVRVTAEDGTTTQTYTIVVTRARATVPGQGVCGRTKQVGEAIVAAVEEAKSCDEVTDEQLSGITGLDLSGEEIASLQAGDFGGLSALELLKLSDNQLTGLPVAIFAELAELETLELQDNQLNRLSSDVLCGVGKLKMLNLANNLLPRLAGDQFDCVPDLQSLLLQGNELSEIPDRFFAGLSSFAELDLADNAVTPLPLTVSLEKVSDGRFRAVAPTGTPFQLNLPVSVSSSGEIADGVGSVTIATGALEGGTIDVTRLSGTEDAVTVDIGVLPALPANHGGYILEKDAALPLEVLPEVSGGICARTEQVRSAILEAVSAVDNCADVTDEQLSGITGLDVSGEEIASLQAGDFHGLAALEKLLLNGNDLRSLPDGIFAGLAAIQSIDLRENRLTSLPRNVFSGLGTLELIGLRENRLTTLANDLFRGLGSLRAIYLGFNQLTTLPSDLFDGLTSLETLGLADNQLSGLPLDVFSSLTALQALPLGNNAISSLGSGVFANLRALRSLGLGDNQLSSLPADVFSGLTVLTTLYLSENQLSSLPADVFSGLAVLETVWLSENQLSELPAGVFSGNRRLKTISLWGNRLTSLPSTVFSGLTGLQTLSLRENQLSELPADVFSGLISLERLWLNDNRLRNLPDGVFSGLTALESLDLGRNAVDPMPLSVTLQKVGSAQFKAVVPTGAPFTLVLPLDISRAGEIDGSASAVTLSVGVLESMPMGVTRVSGRHDAVNVNIGTLPAIPEGDNGYFLQRDSTLPLEILPALAAGDAALSGLGLSDGTLDPVFSSETTSYTTTVENAVSSVTVTPTKSDEDATVAFLDASDQALTDADSGADGQQVDLSVGENTIKVRVTAEDTTTTQTYAIVVTRQSSMGLCDRTEQVRDAIVDAVSDVDACADVTASQLSGITLLRLRGENIRSLKSGDFAGLSELKSLKLSRNHLTTLPADIFSGLAKLESISLSSNELESLSAGAFAGLTELKYLYLSYNELASLPAGVFSGLTNLEGLDLDGNELESLPAAVFKRLAKLDYLELSDNQLSGLPATVFSGLTSLGDVVLESNEITSLPATVFSGLTALRHLDIGDNKLSSLPSGLFSGLTNLESLRMGDNDLGSLETGVFSGLTKLTLLEISTLGLSSVTKELFSDLGKLQTLWMGGNELTSLPADIFSELPALINISLVNNDLASLPPGVFSKVPLLRFLAVANNQLTSLPPGLFSGLTALGNLSLQSNQLSSLPDGIFSGLGSLRILYLERNNVDPLPIIISLEKVGSSQFKAVSPTGAPFSLDLPVSASSGGALEDETQSVTVSIGALESSAVGVTRVAGATQAVTVDIGTLPSLPSNHSGYALQKDTSLPLSILPSTEPTTSATDASFADINGNGRIEADDAMIIYHAFESAGSLGDGETGGTPDSRSTLLTGLAGAPDTSDADLREILRKANEWREVGVEVGGDINGDGRINGSDALAMYYAFEFENLVGDGETGGTTRFRQSLLAEHAAQSNPGDADLKAMLRNAHALRAAAVEAAQ